MRFRPGARLDTGQVQDRRGMGGGRGLALGGGGAGALIVVLLFTVLGVDLPGGGTDPLSIGTGSGSGQPPSELSSTCRTGNDANQREDCRIVGVVNSVQAYWGDQVSCFQVAPTRFFTGQV
jgi:predicted metalloprotease